MNKNLFLAGLLFGMMFVACSSDDDDASSSGHGGDIVGVWKYVGIDVYGQETYMDFMSNGTYIVIDVADRDIRVGTWKRIGKKIRIGLTEGKETDYEEDAEYKIEDGKLYITSEKTGVVTTIVAQRASEEDFSQYLTIQKLDDFLKDKQTIDDYQKNMDDFLLKEISSLCPNDQHPHAIDLGVAGKWACCNVGASSPWEDGGYYAWGETEEKDIYDWSTYKYCDGSSSTVHSLGSDIAGTNYDVAHVKWGGSWKMPSVERIKSLLNNCKSENVFSYYNPHQVCYNIEDYKSDRYIIGGKIYKIINPNNVYIKDGKVYYIDNPNIFYTKDGKMYQLNRIRYYYYNGKVYDLYDSNYYDYLVDGYVLTTKFGAVFYGDYNSHLSGEYSDLEELGFKKLELENMGFEKLELEYGNHRTWQGIIITANNGNQIFLPCCWSDHTSYVGSYGHYWSSTQYPYYSYSAYNLDFSSGRTDWNYDGRDGGRSVRPVTE